MNDPPRLCYRCTLEGALLRAARREPTPARAHDRMLKTLGIAASAVTASAAKAAVVASVVNAKPAMAAFGGATITKLAVIGSVGALLAVGVAREVQRRTLVLDPPAPASTSAARVTERSQATRRVLDAQAPVAHPEPSTRVAHTPSRLDLARTTAPR